MNSNNTNVETTLSQLAPQVVSALGSFAVGSVQFDRIEVKFHFSKPVLEKYAQALVDSCNASELKTTLDVGDMVKYLNTLLMLRILDVNRDPRRHKFQNACPFPTIPAFMSITLENIGLARDLTLGIELTPVIDGDCDNHILQPEEFASFSSKLARYGRVGLEYVDRFSRDLRGSWDFMSMQALDNEVRNHDGKGHLVYALLTSIFEQRWLMDAVMARVSYGPTLKFGGLISEFAKLKG